MNEYSIICAYSRADAIADGVLIDVSEMAKEAGFRYPMAMTSAAWNECVDVPLSNFCQDEKGRLWDVLMVMRFAICGGAGGNIVTFCVEVRDEDDLAKRVDLKAICGPGDDPEPVMTIMLPDED